MLPIRKTLVALGLVLASGFAQAGIITIAGDHFTVSYDESQVDPLYSGGLLSGSQDTLYFLPTSFNVFTDSAASTQASLMFTVAIDPGYAFAGLAFAENGDYFLSDGGQIGAAAALQAVNLDTLMHSTLSMGFSEPGAVGDFTNWALAGLVSASDVGMAQNLQISLDNELTGAPTAGIGFIQKTYVGFRILTEPQSVPEPSGLALMFGGLLAALLAGRRRL